jgi:hypothetical protein
MVTLRPGVAVTEGRIEMTDGLFVMDKETGEALSPSDGGAYLRALPHSISGSYTWAVLEE